MEFLAVMLVKNPRYFITRFPTKNRAKTQIEKKETIDHNEINRTYISKEWKESYNFLSSKRISNYDIGTKTKIKLIIVKKEI